MESINTEARGLTINMKGHKEPLEFWAWSQIGSQSYRQRELLIPQLFLPLLLSPLEVLEIRSLKIKSSRNITKEIFSKGENHVLMFNF